jgi:hypothetical protein
MSMETTNLEPQEQAATQPPAEAAAMEDTGSEFGEGMLIEVDHPDFADLEQEGVAASDADGAEAGPEAGQEEQPGPDGQGDQETGEQAKEQAAPFLTIKHNGQEIPIASQEDAQALAQMGTDYRYKMAMLRPHLDLIRTAAPMLSDPQKAQALMEFLQSGGQVQARPNQAGNEAANGPGEVPQVYVRDPQTGEVARDEQGNPIMADRSFTMAVLDTIKQLGLDQPKESPRQEGPQGYDPILAGVVKREMVGSFAQHAKETYQVEDFESALPLVMQEMIEMGVQRPYQGPDGRTIYDPNDNPRTWDMALARVIAKGKVTPGQGPATVPKRPENKSQLKEQGRAHNLNNQAAPVVDRKAALARALDTRSEDDFVKVVEMCISHPGLEE